MYTELAEIAVVRVKHDVVVLEILDESIDCSSLVIALYRFPKVGV